MKRIRSTSLALASAALATATLTAARPHYGGTLRVETALTQADPAYRERILPLVFETLTAVGPDGSIQPLLARSWESAAGGTRWRIRLRADVVLHQGAVLEAWQAATALRSIERTWRIDTDGDALQIELPAADRDFPSALADMRYAIRVGSSDDSAQGTGPFRIESADASLVRLRPHDGYRSGRPFLDAVTVQLGRSVSAQASDLDAGRADLVSVQPTDARRLSQRGLITVSSRPIELIALLFEPHRAGADSERARRALSASLNRRTIADVLLQRQAAPSDTVLPAWLNGAPREAAVLPPANQRAVVAALPPSERDITLRVDASDSLARAIGERVAADAREAGFAFRLQAPSGLAPRADARLVRIRASAAAPQRAIEPVLSRLLSRAGASPSDPIEKAVLIPIAHVPDVYALGERAASWNEPVVRPGGEWNFAGVWLKADRP